MTTTLFTAILASGLALALSREHRIRRAFQTLASRLAARHAPAGEARWPFVRAVQLPVGGGG